ncbi:MAG: hypothetical protein PHQ43_15850 [Dehalococcoidales bacterium]|nr:hypothetical protein [Dehalococcoidales bacterium]
MAGTINRFLPFIRDNQLLAINRPTYTNAKVLEAGTAESITVPSGATIVLLKGTVDFFVNFGATAVIPVSDINDGSSPILICGGEWVVFTIRGATAISVISGYTGTVIVSFYN